MKGQLLRKLIQLASLAFVIYASLSLHWRNYKVSFNSSRLVALMENEAWGEIYWRNQQLLSWFGDPLEVSDGFLGVPWGATVAGVPFTDPWSVAVLGAQGALPPGRMLLALIVPLGLALLLGKFFCSHLCPARLLFEIAGAVRMGLLRLGLPLPSVALPRVGLWVGLGALLFSVSAGAGIFHFVLPYLTLSGGITLFMLGGVASSTAVAFGLMWTTDLLLAPGQICHSLCPTGALLEVVGRVAPWRLRKRTETPCPSNCNLCQRVCPYGLFPGQETHRPACDACGRCTLVCPDSKLRRSLR